MSCQHTATDLSLASTKIFRKFVTETCQSPETPLTGQKKKHCTIAAKLLQKKLADGYGDMVISVKKLGVSGSEGTVICRLRNFWEWTIAEYVATKRLELIHMHSNVAGQIYWTRKDCELFKPHTMSCEEIPAPQSQTEKLFWRSILEWLLFSSTPAEASIPKDKVSGYTDLLPDLVQPPLIFLTPGWKQKSKAHNQNRKNCKMWGNWVMYPCIDGCHSLPSCCFSAVSSRNPNKTAPWITIYIFLKQFMFLPRPLETKYLQKGMTSFLLITLVNVKRSNSFNNWASLKYIDRGLLYAVAEILTAAKYKYTLGHC